MELQVIKTFREQLRRLERVLGSNIKNETECCGIGLTQCHTLLEIAYRGEASLVDVAAALELDPSTLSRTINSMVNLGWISRKINLEDRRYIALTLTESGQSLFERIELMTNGYYSEVFRWIPKEKHSQIIESLDLFLNAIQQCRLSEAKGCCGGARDIEKE